MRRMHLRGLNHTSSVNHGNKEVCERTFSVSLSECVNKLCVCAVRGGRTDLLGEEGHDGEDDERHEDTVRPELQLVPIHSPGEKKTHTLRLVLIIETSEVTCVAGGEASCALM